MEEKMTANAKKIIQSFDENKLPSEEERFEYTEALQYLIRNDQDTEAMMCLGGYYYENREYPLALKYYEMAEECGSEEACLCLGYIWYYGRTGERDYEKAYRYFSKLMEKGNPVATYKVADMYKNGYFVEKDPARFEAMIEALYPVVTHTNNLFSPLPEVFLRLGGIRIKQKRKQEAEQLYLSARDFLAQRLLYDPFFGNLAIMKEIEEGLSYFQTKRPMDLDLYDLFNTLEKPCEVSFLYRGEEYVVRSVKEDGRCAIEFQDKWYRNVEEFFEKAELNGRRLTSLYEGIYDIGLI